MALARIKKVQVLAHTAVRSEVLSSLQEEGIIQVEHADVEDLDLRAPAPQVSDLDHRLFRLSRALDIFARWDERKLKDRVLGQKPQLSSQQRQKALQFDYETVLDQAERLEREENDLQSQTRFLEKEEEFLRPLEGLGLPVSEVKATESTEVLLGVLPLSRLEDLERIAATRGVWFDVIERTKRAVYLLMVYHKDEHAQVEQEFKDLDFNTLYFTDSMSGRVELQDGVKDLLLKISAEKNKIRQRREELDKEGQRLSVNREPLMLVYDVLRNERTRLLTSRRLGETEQLFYLEGWIRDSDIERFSLKLQRFADLVEVFIRDPLPEEDPPSVLSNPKPGKPFEIVTKLYGLPQKGTMDPTMALAPFFFLFVGITVSEAGYGLLVALLSLLYLKFAKPRGGSRQFLMLLGLLSVSTVVIGTLIGGWFGFPIRKLMILDPLQDPLSFLGLALGLGFIQVWFGTLLRMVSSWKNRKYLQAFFVQGGWLLLLPSLTLFAITKQSPWGILTLVGAAGIVFFAVPSRNPLARFFGGLYSLYDISRYLADVLSYSRLLALGLATSVIAMVVNTLCQAALGIPWVGWLFAALIFIGGHLFNLGISYLGGFVHSMRLQFVEFFSKFFQAGGRPFEPLELEGKYVEFI